MIYISSRDISLLYTSCIYLASIQYMYLCNTVHIFLFLDFMPVCVRYKSILPFQSLSLVVFPLTFPSVSLFFWSFYNTEHLISSVTRFFLCHQLIIIQSTTTFGNWKYTRYRSFSAMGTEMEPFVFCTFSTLPDSKGSSRFVIRITRVTLSVFEQYPFDLLLVSVHLKFTKLSGFSIFLTSIVLRICYCFIPFFSAIIYSFWGETKG